MQTHRGRPLILACAAVLCLTGMLLLPATPGGAVSCKFPATGQTTAYDADTQTGSDTEVPDDGTVQAGEALQYVDKGKGWIQDKKTGLMWEKKSNDGGLHDYTNTYPWSKIGYVTIWDWLLLVNTEGGKGFAGFNDWRIPNVKELQSIVDYQNFNPAVASPFNTNCGGNTVFTGSCTAVLKYWSSSTLAIYTPAALAVGFDFGNVDGYDKQINTYPVRAVRGGC